MKNIGSLYLVKKNCWLVFFNKNAQLAAAAITPLISVNPGIAAYMSKEYNCNVSYVSPNDIFVLLETDEQFKKVLTCNGDIGWIWVDDSYKSDCFEEVTQTK